MKAVISPQTQSSVGDLAAVSLPDLSQRVVAIVESVSEALGGETGYTYLIFITFLFVLHYYFIDSYLEKAEY